jgi:hypothetical protein
VALGRAYIEIHADTKPFRRDLDDGVKQTLKNSTQGIGKAATQGISQGLKQFRFLPGTFQGVLITGLAALIVGAAPAIATALSAAFTTAFGLAGIGAGLALAISSSPEVQAAGEALGTRLLQGLQSAAQVFVTPILQSIDILGRRFEHILPGIEAGFASLAPHVTTLATGIADFVSNLMPGITAAFRNAGPAIDEFSRQLAELGTTLSDAFESLSDDPETVVEGLRLLFGLLNVTIAGTVGVINFLSEAWNKYVNTLDVVTEKMGFFGPLAIIVQEGLQKLQGTTATLTPITDAYGDTLLKQGQGANYAAVQGNGLVETLREVWSVQLQVSNSAIAFEAAIDGVSEAFKENKKNIDINTEAGRENVTQVNQSIEAAIREHEAQIAAGAGIEVANKAYQNRIARLRETLRQAGLTEKQIDSLIGAYEEVPPALTTKVTTPGLPGAITRMQALARAQREIARDILINVRASTGDGSIGGRAEGGVVTKPEISWIGEAGPEAVVPLTDPARAQQVMAEAGLVSPMTINIIVDGEVIERRVVRATNNQARQVTSQPRSI